MLKEKRLHLAAVLLAAVAAIAMLGLLITLFHTDGIASVKTREDMPLTTIDRVTQKKIHQPAAPAGVVEQYTFTLDGDYSHDAQLAFYIVHQHVKVYFDDELVYSLQPKGAHRITKTLGSSWVMIPLYEEDSGKTVRVEITPAYQCFQNREITFLVGNSLAIYQDRLRRDFPQILMGSIALLIGVVFLCIFIGNLVKKRPDRKIGALGLFSVMLGIWKLNDTRFTPFMDGGEPVLFYYSAIAMLMFALVPMIEWTRDSFSERKRRILDLYEAAIALIMLALIILQVRGIYDLREVLVVIHCALGMGAALLISLAIISRREKADTREKMPMQLRLAFICVAGIFADVVTFYMKGNSSGLMFSLAALLLYILVMGLRSTAEYSLQQAKIAKLDRELAEKEHRLTDSRIKMMMSQIRSHFIFNVLTTISTYCKIDPQTADEALICFSRYLRRNIRMIEEDKLIPFDTELAQLEDYVALEQLRFTGQINFEKRIGTTSFSLPPLTVQPLVENAIKHGFLEHGRTGTVSLCTEKKGEKIMITVKDDGAGFDPEALTNRDSIGLKNVRYRLQIMVDGSLSIESRPGEGTTVRIEIPAKEEPK